MDENDLKKNIPKQILSAIFFLINSDDQDAIKKKPYL